VALRASARGAAVPSACITAPADAHQRSAPAAGKESAVAVGHDARAATFWTADGQRSDTRTLRIVLPERRPAKARDCRSGPSPFVRFQGYAGAGIRRKNAGMPAVKRSGGGARSSPD
jgi:hypothetical protein